MSLTYSDNFAIVTPEETLEMSGRYYRIMDSLRSQMVSTH